MGDKSGIEWTQATWNPVTGCTKVSAGCKHCYAKHQAWPRLRASKGTVYYGRDFEDVQCHPERLEQPLRWTKPRSIFVNSMSDLFHEDVPFEFIASVFAIMGVTTRHTYQILTKRPERMREFFRWALERRDEDGTYYQLEPHIFDSDEFSADERIMEHWPDWIEWEPQRPGRGGYDNCGPGWPYDNVWLGVSVEDQETADKRIHELRMVAAAVRFISAEPLLGPVNLTCINNVGTVATDALRGVRVEPSTGLPIDDDQLAAIDWVIVGGESGKGARPMHPDWVRSLCDQCAAADVPFFFKQWGEWAPFEWGAKTGIRHPQDEQCMSANGYHVYAQVGHAAGLRQPDDALMARVGKKAAGRLLDGREHNEVPARRITR